LEVLIGFAIPLIFTVDSPGIKTDGFGLRYIGSSIISDIFPLAPPIIGESRSDG